MQRLMLTIVILFVSFSTNAQNSEIQKLSLKEMQTDLDWFIKIRKKANSGLYKWRSKSEIDSTYAWAKNELYSCNDIIDFYNVIVQLTDFEGSCHNATTLSAETNNEIYGDRESFFPFPIKIIGKEVYSNYTYEGIPVGSKITSINDEPTNEIISNLHKYYTTDGYNTSSKKRGINLVFSRYYRYHYGAKKYFQIKYVDPKSSTEKEVQLASVNWKTYVQNLEKRHSLPLEKSDLSDSDRPYEFKYLNDTVGYLEIPTFSIGGNAESPDHKKYVRFLDSMLIDLKEKGINNFIIDVRKNGGGTDPNDLVTYAAIADRPFQENTEAWVSMRKVPYWRHVNAKGVVPGFLKPFAKFIFNPQIRKEFSIERNGRFYQNQNDSNKMLRQPNKNVFKGNVYLLISPRVASAGSLFAALAASNNNTTVIGEETSGGYHGHNGHQPIRYELPKSKINTSFSIVNLTQDVPDLPNQKFGRGVLPDHHVEQSFEDFMKNTDTQLEYTLKLINEDNGM